MRSTQQIPQKGFSVWLLRMIGVHPTSGTVFYVRVGIIILCMLGIFFFTLDKQNASEYGNLEELQMQYLDEF